MISGLDINSLYLRNSSHANKSQVQVKAIRSYHAQNSNELTFMKGQQFIVISENKEMGYYEVMDIENHLQRGYVKVEYVEIFPSSPAPLNSLPPTPFEKTASNSGVGLNVIGFALKNLNSPPSGYIEVNKNDPMLIIEEFDTYYIAKPIGKLGTPGKINKEDVQLQNNKPPVPPPKDGLRTQSLPVYPKLPSKDSSNKTHRVNLSLSASKNYLNSKLASSRRRGSVQPKALYSNSMMGILEDPENIFTFENPSIQDVMAIKLHNHEDNDYIQLSVKYLDRKSTTVYRKQEDLAQMIEKLQLDFQSYFNSHPNLLPSIPTINYALPDIKVEYIQSPIEIYLADWEAFFADLIYIDAVPTMNYLLTLLRETEQDVNLDNLFNQPQLKPIQIGPSFSSTTLTKLDFTQSSIASTSNNLKIKLQIEDNLFAFWLNQWPLNYDEFQSKILLRLGLPPSSLLFRDPTSNRLKSVMTEREFLAAISGSPNHLYVIAKV